MWIIITSKCDIKVMYGRRHNKCEGTTTWTLQFLLQLTADLDALIRETERHAEKFTDVFVTHTET